MYWRNNVTGHLSPGFAVLVLRSNLQVWFSLAPQQTQQIQGCHHLSWFWNPPVSFHGVPTFHEDQIDHIVWIKDSGVLPPSFSLFQRISSYSLDSCRALFEHLPRPPKRSCFAFPSSTFFGGTEFSVANNGQFIAFVLQVSIKRCNHYFQTFRFIIFPVFVFYHRVESLEESVKLNRIAIFDSSAIPFSKLHFFKTDNQKVVLFTVFSLLELFFSSSIVVAVAEENLLKTPTIVSLANFQRIQMLRHPSSHLIGYLWLPILIE